MASVTDLPQIVRNTGRLRQVVSVLAKYGLAPWLSRVPLPWLKRHLETTDGVAIAHLTTPERVREAITEIGTTFIKFGQVVSTRPDIVGMPLAEELARLQSQTPPDDSAVIRQLIGDELGKPVSELFSDFDDRPLASASIGQVHRATLPDGSLVVVKVQHMGIEDRIRNDLEIAGELAALAEAWSDELSLYQPVATVRELRRTLLAELDFHRETRNLRTFADHFGKASGIHFPAVYPELCTRRVLTMQHLDGVHLTNRNAVIALGADPHAVARKVAETFLDMVFRDGFFHADPHPGNLLLLPDREIGIIDCGMTARIDDRLREQIENLLMAIADSDVDAIVDAVASMTDVPATMDHGTFYRDIGELFDRYAFSALDQVNVSEALSDATNVIRQHRIRLPARVSMLIRMLVVLEGTLVQVSPELRLLDVLRDYRLQILRNRFSPSRLRRKSKAAMRQWSHLLEAVPHDLGEIVNRARQGTFDVTLVHRRLDTIVNRLAIGLLSSSLFVASSLMWTYDAAPLVGQFSLPGVAGFVFACYLAIRLLRAIRASGGL